VCCDHSKEEHYLSEGGATIDRAHGRSVQICIGGRRKGHPYFQCLKRNSRIVWTRECEEAFLKLKEYLASPPVLCKPQLGTPLRLYFAVTEKAISSVLVQD